MNYNLRPAQPADEPFLLTLFQLTHGQEFLLLPVPESCRDEMIRMQFRAQADSYVKQYPESEHFIVELEGAPAGHLWLGMGNEEVRVIDLALLPSCQGRGLGSEILKDLIARAVSRARTLYLSVRQSNEAAVRLYERLGFTQVAGGPLHFQMEHKGKSQAQPVG